MTLSLLLDAGAVKSPVVEIVPADADQLTDVLVVPVTVAENCCFPPGTSEMGDAGVIVIFTGDAAEDALKANCCLPLSLCGRSVTATAKL